LPAVALQPGPRPEVGPPERDAADDRRRDRFGQALERPEVVQDDGMDAVGAVLEVGLRTPHGLIECFRVHPGDSRLCHRLIPDLCAIGRSLHGPRPDRGSVRVQNLMSGP